MPLVVGAMIIVRDFEDRLQGSRIPSLSKRQESSKDVILGWSSN